MALALNDFSDLVDRLGWDTLADGGVGWAGELLQRIVDDSELDADVVISKGGRDVWNVEVTFGELAVALVDVVADVDRPLDHVDLVESKARRRWLRVTREGSNGELRPWIGVAALSQTEGSTNMAEKLVELIHCRSLDAAFSNAQHTGAPKEVLGIQSFAASLLGRLVLVRTVLEGRPIK